MIIRSVAILAQCSWHKRFAQAFTQSVACGLEPTPALTQSPTPAPTPTQSPTLALAESSTSALTQAMSVDHDFAKVRDIELARMENSMADLLHRLQDCVCSTFTQGLADNLQELQYDLTNLLEKIDNAKHTTTYEDVDAEFAKLVLKFDELKTTCETFLQHQ